METVSVADRQSVKDAIENLDGGEIFNEAVAVQYQQGKLQQLAVQREVQQLKNAVHDNAESWETANLVYVPFNFGILYRRMSGNLFVFWPRTWEKWTGVLDLLKPG